MRYIRTRLEGAKYWNARQRLHLLARSARAAISSRSRAAAAPGIDPVRLTDRFFLGEPQIPRLRHSRRRPARPAHPIYTTPTARRHDQLLGDRSQADHRRRARRPRLLSRPRRARDPARRRRHANWACGRRSSSMSAPCSACKAAHADRTAERSVSRDQPIRSTPTGSQQCIDITTGAVTPIRGRRQPAGDRRR